MNNLKLIKNYYLNDVNIETLDITLDGLYGLAGCNNSDLNIIDFEADEESEIIKTTVDKIVKGPCNLLKLSATNNFFLCGFNESKYFSLYDTEKLQFIRYFHHTEKIKFADFLDDNCILVASNSLEIFDKREKNKVWNSKNFEDQITDFSIFNQYTRFTPNFYDVKSCMNDISDNCVLTVSSDGWFRLFDLRKGIMKEWFLNYPITKLRASKTYVPLCYLIQDKFSYKINLYSYFAFFENFDSSSMQTSEIHDSPCLLYSFEFDKFKIHDFTFTNDSSHIIFGSDDGKIFIRKFDYDIKDKSQEFSSYFLQTDNHLEIEIACPTDNKLTFQSCNYFYSYSKFSNLIQKWVI